MGLISELRRRNVFRMAVLYIVAAWLVMQVADVATDLVPLPDWTGPAVLVLLSIGFPIALILSWFYELTPAGIFLGRHIGRTAEPHRARAGRQSNGKEFVVPLQGQR
jgi:hypothetical protein